MLQENAVDLKATIANLTETLNEFKRKFFGISSEKSKKKQTDEPVCEEASEQESGIPVKEHTFLFSECYYKGKTGMVQPDAKRASSF